MVESGESFRLACWAALLLCVAASVGCGGNEERGAPAPARAEEASASSQEELRNETWAIGAYADQFRMSKKRPPASLAELRHWIGEALGEEPRSDAFVDPWGSPYVLLRRPRGKYVVKSHGPDRVTETEDDYQWEP